MNIERKMEAVPGIENRWRMMELWQVLSRQLARLFMGQNVLVPEMEKILRREAIKVALSAEEFAMVDRDAFHKQTFSHAAVTTGLTRQEISDVAGSRGSVLPADGGDLHRLVRVVTAWRSDPDYLDEHGDPREIPLRGPNRSFHQLCRRYGRDTPTRPIADTLVRNGNAEWVDPGAAGHALVLRLVSPVITAESGTPEELALLSRYASDFIASMNDWLAHRSGAVPRFREAYFNDIDPARIDAARAALRAEMENANRRYIECLKPFRAKEGIAGCRVGVGSFTFEGQSVEPDSRCSSRTLPGGQIK